jgi:hypothetical protein
MTTALRSDVRFEIGQHNKPQLIVTVEDMIVLDDDGAVRINTNSPFNAFSFQGHGSEDPRAPRPDTSKR